MDRTIDGRMTLSLLMSLFLSILAFAMLAGPALATNIGVTTTQDEDNSDGDCSLREAIIAANTNAARDACPSGSGTDTIGLSAGTYELSIPQVAPPNIPPNETTVGDLDITGVTIVSGAGADATIIQGQPGFNDRIFDNTGTTTISGLTITGGDLTTEPFFGTGGGARNNTGTLTLNGVAVVGNKAEVRGGGVESREGTLNVTDSTVSGNQTSGDGGAIYLGSGTANIINSTISGNRAEVGGVGGGTGGGISVSGTTAVSVESSTIASNSSINPGGGIFATQSSTVGLENSIVSDNSTTDCETNFSASINSRGHNLGGDGSCGLTQATDEQNTDPLLGPLQDNGGPTDTHALLAGSPAVDSGDSDQTVDQREKTRPKDGDGDGTATDDIGAFEKGTAPPPPNTAPKIAPLFPDPGSSISDRTPRIRAKISDRETNLARSDIELFIDGKKKRDFSYDRSKDRLTYQTGRLERTRHTVKIRATDGQSRSTETWSFMVRKKG